MLFFIIFQCQTNHQADDLTIQDLMVNLISAKHKCGSGSDPHPAAWNHEFRLGESDLLEDPKGKPSETWILWIWFFDSKNEDLWTFFSKNKERLAASTVNLEVKKNRFGTIWSSECRRSTLKFQETKSGCKNIWFEVIKFFFLTNFFYLNDSSGLATHCFFRGETNRRAPPRPPPWGRTWPWTWHRWCSWWPPRTKGQKCSCLIEKTIGNIKKCLI